MKPVDGIYYLDGGWFWQDENLRMIGDPKNKYNGFQTQQEAIDARTEYRKEKTK